MTERSLNEDMLLNFKEYLVIEEKVRQPLRNISGITGLFLLLLGMMQ